MYPLIITSNDLLKDTVLPVFKTLKTTGVYTLIHMNWSTLPSVMARTSVNYRLWLLPEYFWLAVPKTEAETSRYHTMTVFSHQQRCY